MSDVVASVALQVKSSQARAEIARVKNDLGDLKGAAAGVSAAFAGLFVGQKAFGLASSLVAEASNVQEAQGKFRAVFKGLTDDAWKYVEELKGVYGQSELIALNSLATSTSILKNSGVSARRALEMSGELARAASDLATFTNAQGGVEQTSQALISALNGEREMLKTLGVAIYEADVEEERLRLSKQGVVYATEKEAKMEATLSLIRKQFGDITGQTVREGENFASQLGVLRSLMSDLKASFGDALIEPATAAVVKLRGLAESLLTLDDSTKRAVVGFGLGGAAVAGLGVGVAGLVGAVKTYINIATLAETATGAAETAAFGAAAAKHVESSAADLSAEALKAEKRAQDLETAATQAAARAAALATQQKRLETAATLANTKAILAENAAQRARAALETARATKDPKKIAAAEAAANAAEALATRSRAGATKATGDLSNVSEMLSGARQHEYNSSQAALSARWQAHEARFAADSASRRGKIGGALAVAGNAPGLKQLGQFGDWLAKLVPITGRLGSALKLVVRFGGPIGAVIGALEALKHAPDFLEVFLQEWYPKIKSGLVDVGRKAFVEWIPAVGKWLVDLVPAALHGASEVAKRLIGLETETQRGYELDKKLAEQRQRAAQATEKAAAKEAELAARRDGDKATEDAFNGAAKAIRDAGKTDDEKKIEEASKKAADADTALKAAVDAMSLLRKYDWGALQGAQQTALEAQVNEAKLVGAADREKTLDDLKKRYDEALDAATTDAAKAAVVKDFGAEIAKIREDDAKLKATVDEETATADNLTAQAAFAAPAQRDKLMYDRNTALANAEVARAKSWTGDDLDALDAFARDVANAGKDATEALIEFRQALENDAYEQEKYFAERRGDSFALRDLALNRAVDLEIESAFEADPKKRRDLQNESFRLQQEAFAAEDEAAEKRKRAAEQASALAYSQLTNNRDRWAFQSQRFATADAAFDSARNDDERFEAVQKMQEAFQTAKEIEKAQRELAKRDAKPIDPQTAMTRGSAEAFKLENRIRNVWQDKMLHSSTQTNGALGRIYERLGTIARNNTEPDTITMEVR